MKRRLLLRLFVLFPLMLLSACLEPLQPRRSPTPAARQAVAVKQVVDKREPNYLIAVDGTSCTVSADRFRKVRVPSRVLCAWS